MSERRVNKLGLTAEEMRIAVTHGRILVKLAEPADPARPITYELTHQEQVERAAKLAGQALRGNTVLLQEQAGALSREAWISTAALGIVAYLERTPLGSTDDEVTEMIGREMDARLSFLNDTEKEQANSQAHIILEEAIAAQQAVLAPIDNPLVG